MLVVKPLLVSERPDGVTEITVTGVEVCDSLLRVHAKGALFRTDVPEGAIWSIERVVRAGDTVLIEAAGAGIATNDEDEADAEDTAVEAEAAVVEAEAEA